MIYLLLKTHKITGLKYLCKTVRDNWQEYKGSGNYWRRHLKEHGSNIDTELLFQTENVEEFRKNAKEWSIKLNVVDSKEFANLVMEEGQGGDISKYRKNFKHSEESKKLFSKLRSGSGNVMFGKIPSEYQRQRTKEVNSHPFSEERKIKHRQSLLGRKFKHKIKTCNVCGKSGGSSNMTRHHFENCKMNR